MPMTSTKNFRLSSGFGVSISMWPRWARSKIGSDVIVLLLIAKVLGSSSSAKAGDPVRRGFSVEHERLWNTGSSAFADDDGRMRGYLSALVTSSNNSST